MKRFAPMLKVRDHLTALLATLACAHVIGLISVAGFLPHGSITLDRPSGQILGAVLCGLVHAIVLTLLYRRRLVAGPLYRCGESRPAADYGKRYEPGTDRILDSWHYR